MRFGIRGKLVGTLVLAALLPMGLSLGAGLYAFHQAQTKFVGQSFRAMARQQAEHLSTLLSSQVDFLWLINQLPQTESFLAAASDREEPTTQRVEQIEQRWVGMGEDDPLLESILNNELAGRWKAVQRQRPRIAEVLITDRRGRLVAATHQTSDYYQADEAWWQRCWAGGRGRVTLSGVVFDESAIARTGQRGTEVVDLCIPVDAARGPDGEGRGLVGVMKISLDAAWLLEQLRQIGPSKGDELGQEVWLAGGDGRPVMAVEAKLSEDLLAAMRGRLDGFVVTRGDVDREVIGFSRVVFTGRGMEAPRDWYVLVSTGRKAALASMWPTFWMILLGGVFIIGLCFVGGFWIARREILVPLLELRHGTKMLEEGKLGFRLKTPDEPGSKFRHDQLGEMAREFNHMALELERNVGALDQANRIKQQFIDLASHELRTPVTYILGVTELAQRQGSPEAALLGRIGAKAQRLNHIVENMFKLLQKGLFESALNLGPVDLEKLLSAAAGELEPFIKARKQTLELRTPQGLEPITADAEKLRDIVDNLLTNAIRFSPDGSELEAEVRDVDSVAQIVISDTGPGIAPEDAPYIFEPFYPGKAPLGRHTSGEFEYMSQGIGLGLSVVKRFAEMHGGTVKAEPRERRGTRFIVTLPKHPMAERTGK